jgi:hypothetical protein
MLGAVMSADRPPPAQLFFGNRPARNIYYKYIVKRRPYACKEEDCEESREKDLFVGQEKRPFRN